MPPRLRRGAGREREISAERKQETGFYLAAVSDLLRQVVGGRLVWGSYELYLVEHGEKIV